MNERIGDSEQHDGIKELTKESKKIFNNDKNESESESNSSDDDVNIEEELKMK